MAWPGLPLLAACGTSPAPAPPRPDEAPGRARERDDATAIGDTGIGLAAADLVRSRNAKALRTAREVRAELLRRGAPVPDAVLLAEALALYRTGDVTGAWRRRP